jgi:serine/threonine-protein kinase
VIGETVGNFEIISRLGKGGMGEVWLAQQKSIKTKVAIKMLQSDVSTNTKHVQRFFNEAVAVSQIHHSGIVKIFDVGYLASGQAYLVMEYLQGETMTSRIQNAGHLPFAQVADFGRQIASVLDATHAANITHRDLKPDNIYLIRDAELATGVRVKVLDFGIAKLDTTVGPRMTALSVSSIGTPNYMSPEQWHSLAEVDWRTDAYALGCVVFEMATGRPPFIAQSRVEVCSQHLSEPPPVPSRLVQGLPAQFDDIVARLLAKEPADRPTMREVMGVFTQLGMPYDVALPTIPPTGMRSPLAPPPQNSAAAFAPTSAASFSQGTGYAPTATPQNTAYAATAAPPSTSTPPQGTPYAQQPYAQQGGASQPPSQFAQHTGPGASQAAQFPQQAGTSPSYAQHPGAQQAGPQHAQHPGASQPFAPQHVQSQYPTPPPGALQYSTPAPGALQQSQFPTPQPGASQPFAAPQPYGAPPPGASLTAPVGRPKGRRVGLFVAIGGLAIAGTVGAVVISSQSGSGSGSSAKEPPAGSSTAANTAPVDAAARAVSIDAAAVAVIAPRDAAAIASIADAAEPPAPPPVAAGPLHVDQLPRLKSGVLPTTRTALTLDVCIDEKGAVTDVQPESAPRGIRVMVETVRFEPFLKDSVATAVCAPVKLAIAKAPTKEPSNTGPVATDNLPERLTSAMMGPQLATIKRLARVCDRGRSNTTFTLTLTISPAGAVTNVQTDGPDPALTACAANTARSSRFPRTKQGGVGVVSIAFTARQQPPQNPPPYNGGGDY